jgi:MoaA/NifB/PqqE/SkfB family radical SAM enzyme
MTNQLDSIICLRPFYSLELNVKGNVSACCPAWSKGMIGNTKKKNLKEIWNDVPLQRMRQLMLEGRWEKICRPSCPIITNYRMKNERVSLNRPESHLITEEILSAVRSRQTIISTGPTWINLANSAVCNLNCIMCGRTNYKGDDYLTRKEAAEVTDFLPGLRELFLTGNGDPFARPDTRELMLNLDTSLYPNLKINLLTNGLLLPRYWERIQQLNFGFIDISCDAATERTYEKIRLGGKWQDLLRAFAILSEYKNRFRYIMINMTVMRENYREIPAFVKLASRYGFGAGINRIRGKWGDQNFFTSANSDDLNELRHLILESRSIAEDLNVSFNSSSFDDIMAGQTLPSRVRYQQMAIDVARSIYYRLN